MNLLLKISGLTTALLFLWTCSSGGVNCEGVLLDGVCHPCKGTLENGVCVPYEQDVRTGEECSDDEECLPLGVCLDKLCGRQCSRDQDCPNGACRLYRCVDPGLDTLDSGLQDVPGSDSRDRIPCEKHIECADYEMACIEGFCDRECIESWHCEDPGLVCEHYRCVDAPEVDAVVYEDTLEDTGPICPPENRGYGVACECAAQCATGLCVQNTVLGSGSCTQYCPGGDCPNVDLCVVVDMTGTRVCVANDAGKSTSCNPDLALCMSGQYIKNSMNSCVCTVPCQNAAGYCPQGQACHFDGNQRFCVPVGTPCTANYNGCFGVCVGLEGEQGTCSAICYSAADCPGGWSCDPLGDGMSACVP